MRDLDIRGSGDILGAEQSGFINDIGYETYQKILAEALTELKNNEFKELFKDEKKSLNDSLVNYVEDIQIETDLELLIPYDYVNNIEERLSLYQELDKIETDEELALYEKSLVDRFGEIPQETKELLDTINIKKLGKEIGFEKMCQLIKATTPLTFSKFMKYKLFA